MPSQTRRGCAFASASRLRSSPYTSARGLRLTVTSRRMIWFISGPSKIRSSHSFSTRFFVDLGIGEVEFHHHLLLIQRQFPHDLFHVRPVFHIQTCKDFKGFLHFHDHVQTDQVAQFQPCAASGGRSSTRLRKLPSKRNTSIRKPKGATSASACCGSGGRSARCGGSRGRWSRPRRSATGPEPKTAGHRDLAFPQVGTPGPVGAHRLADGGGADHRKGQPVFGLMDHPVQFTPHLAGALAQGTQRLQPILGASSAALAHRVSARRNTSRSSTLSNRPAIVPFASAVTGPRPFPRDCCLRGNDSHITGNRLTCQPIPAGSPLKSVTIPLIGRPQRRHRPLQQPASDRFLQPRPLRRQHRNRHQMPFRPRTARQ